MAHATRQYADQEKPWEKQAWEDDTQYNAFKCYVGLPRHGRSILRAYQVGCEKPRARNVPGSWGQWCSKNDWVYRSEQLDQLDREERISEEASKLADIRLDTLQIIHDQVIQLGISLEGEHKPYDRAYAIQTLARMLDLLQLKKKTGEDKPGTDKPYEDDWLVSAKADQEDPSA